MCSAAKTKLATQSRKRYFAQDSDCSCWMHSEQWELSPMPPRAAGATGRYDVPLGDGLPLEPISLNLLSKLQTHFVPVSLALPLLTYLAASQPTYPFSAMQLHHPITTKYYRSLSNALMHCGIRPGIGSLVQGTLGCQRQQASRPSSRTIYARSENRR